MAKRKTITIEINGEPYETIFDKKGVQRFPKSKLITHLVDSSQVDLNRLSRDFQEGKFSKREYMQFYRDIGYSVCGYMDVFPNLKVENPLWDKT